MQPNDPLSQMQQAIAQLTGQQLPVASPDGQVVPQQQNPLMSMTLPQLLQELKNEQGMYPNLQKSEIPMHTPIGSSSAKFTDGQHPVESVAFGQAVAGGADPDTLAHMSQYLNRDQFVGLCEAFVEQATQGKQGIYPSANAAWQAQQGSAQKDMSKIKPGDTVYFAPDQSNGGYGHTGVYVGGNQFVSATYDGVKKYDLNDWKQATGQQLLGYIPKNSQTPAVHPQVQQQQAQQVMQKPSTAQKLVQSSPKPLVNLPTWGTMKPQGGKPPFGRGVLL